MELTVDQALQQGVAAHKDGKLQDAERLYRAILQVQPNHPDANHNLGVLAVADGKPLEAIPLFKLALDANSHIEQFWLSYIDVLIRVERFDEAQRVLVEGKESGVSPDKLDVISQHLQGTIPNHKSKIAKSQTLSEKRKRLAEKKKSKKRKVQGDPSSAAPSQDQIKHLLGHYQAGRLEEAKPLAMSLTQQFPKHPFGWKALGSVLKQMGRLGESLAPMQSAVKLSPQDAEAHSNLGITLQELGRLDEAETSFRQAIALKPVYTEAHNNLGNTLKGLGRLGEAEASLRQAIALKPDYAEAHSNLGIVLQELGRLGEAETSLRQAIALKPDFAEAHSNLGITLNELGRLDEAEASYTQAIALKPDYAEAHSNLGNTLQELGRLDEAEASYRKAIALKPGYAAAHSNLGVTLKELGRLDEAEASDIQAIALKLDYAEAHNNLGNTLQELGRLDEAEASYNQAIALKPDYAEALQNLSIVQSYMNNLEIEIVSLQNILQIDADNYGLTAGVSLAICKFLEGNVEDSKKYLLAASKIQEKTSPKFKNQKVYWKYLSGILSWHEENYFNPYNLKTDKILFVVGESHSLVSHHLRVQSFGSVMLCEAKLIKGCKQWHLANSSKNQYKHQFESIFCALPKHSYVLLAIGEIDCRLDSGIIKHKNKFPEKEIEEIISNTVKNYLNYIVNNNSDYQHTIIIQGVPCPNIDTGTYSENEVTQLIEVIDTFNCELKVQSTARGFGFLDTHQLTNKGDGTSNDFWHLDDTHLSPEGMLEAWRRYTSGHSYE